MAADLDSYKIRNELEKLKDAIVKFTPDNDGLVNTVKGLTPKNNLLINSLIDAWKTREAPEISEKDIISQNLEYQASPERQANLAQVGMDPNDLVNEKRWVLKSKDGWYGWIPEAQAYTARPIIYGDELDYEKLFEKKVLKYQVSGTINLYRTMTKFLETFNSMGLTDEQICEILLELCKKHVAHQYSSLARHTENAEKLWIELASSLNNDVEESKVRKALCGITRKVAEPINLPLYDIKSLYDQILDLTHPGLDPQVHEEKATKHACKCIEFLVSKDIKKLFDNYQRDKVIHNEKINLVELVNMITQQENLRDEYKITQTMYLPPACSMLDIQPDVNTNANAILVMQNETWKNAKNERSNKDYRIQRSRSNSSGYARKEDGNNKDYRNERRYSRGDRSPRHQGDKPYFRRDYSREPRRSSSQQRGDQPRREQRGRSGDKYRSYGRDNNDASPYRSGSRRRYSSHDREDRDDRYIRDKYDRSRRGSRSPGSRYNNDNRESRRSPGRDRRMSGEYQRQSSRKSPGRDGQPQQSRRSASRDGRDASEQCRRCGGFGHTATLCEMYPFWRGKPCDCGFLHKRRDCNSNRGSNLTEVKQEDRRENEQNAVQYLYQN